MSQNILEIIAHFGDPKFSGISVIGCRSTVEKRLPVRCIMALGRQSIIMVILIIALDYVI